MKILITLFVLVIMASCNQPPSIGIANVGFKTSQTSLQKRSYNNTSVTAISSPIGYYVGMFIAEEYKESENYVWANRITISIDSILKDKIYGHSIVAGNNRPFKGDVKKENDGYQAVVKEPGDNKYDGVFMFAILDDGATLKGEWIANDKKLPVTKRSYALKKRTFNYDPTLTLPESIQMDILYETSAEEDGTGEFITKDALKYNASVQMLKSKDVENMYKADLEFIRNAIYARHGYSFKNRKVRYIFDNYVDWYMPISTDITKELTELEKKNIELIKRYENHAERYYDSFGR